MAQQFLFDNENKLEKFNKMISKGVDKRVAEKNI